jgi:ligand-binding sensor domain-containing protein
MEQQAQLDAREAPLLKLRVQQAEQAWNAAQEKRTAAAREEEDTRRRWEACQEKTRVAAREELAAQRRVDELKQQERQLVGRMQGQQEMQRQQAAIRPAEERYWCGHNADLRHYAGGQDPRQAAIQPAGGNMSLPEMVNKAFEALFDGQDGGVSVADITGYCCKNLGRDVPKSAVMKVVEQMCIDGMCYSTIDDEHYAKI